MSQLSLLDSVKNDGYIYCILTGMKNKMGDNLVKIGKIEMKRNETEHQVINKLLRRYNTYYPDYEIVQFIRTGNHHEAEIYIFDLLKHLHYKREHYIYNAKDIEDAFNNGNEKFPNIQELLEKSSVEDISLLNKNIREQEI